MKSTKCDKGGSIDLPYPKLMSDVSGNVVLMTSYKEGTVVFSDHHYVMGHRSANWMMSYFKDHSGTITLENSNDH
jgi:hypothetical protein